MPEHPTPEPQPTAPDVESHELTYANRVDVPHAGFLMGPDTQGRVWQVTGVFHNPDGTSTATVQHPVDVPMTAPGPRTTFGPRADAFFRGGAR